MISHQPASPGQPQLRLFAPEESSEPTLSQVFEQVVGDCRPDARPRSLDQCRETLGIWERLMGSPPAKSIDRTMGKSFRLQLEQRVWRGKRIAPNTVRKHLVTIQGIFQLAGPATANIEDAAGVLEKPPRIKKPPVSYPEEVEMFELREIGAWLDACHTAIMPEIPGIEPGDWWRAAVVFDYNVPFRLETLLHLQWRWLEKEDGDHWMKVPAWAIKGRRPRPKFYVNKHALEALERLRGIPEEYSLGKIFPMPNTLSWLHEQRRRLLETAGLPEDRRFGFHGLRKSCNTELQKMGADAAAGLHLGHARGKDVNHDFYTHRSIVAGPVSRLPQPPWHPGREGRQILLF